MENYINNKKENLSMNRIALMFFTLLILISSAFAVDTEMIRWEFEEGSGVVTFDTSGNSWTGILAGAIFTGGGNQKWGNYAVEFDGSQDWIDGIIATDENSSQTTISFWTYGNVNNTQQTFFVAENNDTTLLLDWDDLPTPRFRFTYEDESQVLKTIYPDNVQLNNSQWYHHMIMIDYSTDRFLYYRDNNLKYNQTLTNPNEPTEALAFRLGNTFPGVRDLNGRMDEFRAFNFIANETQRTSLYTSNTIHIPTLTLEEQGELIFEELNITGTEQINLINTHTPYLNSNLTNKIQFQANLNFESSCSLYINNNLVSEFNEILAFNYETSLSLGEHNYLMYCDYVDNQTLYYDITNFTSFNVIEGSPSTINFIFLSTHFDINSQSLYASTSCLEKGIIIPGVTQPYNRYANPNPVYFEEVSQGQVSFTLSPGTYEFCLLNGIVQYNTADNYSEVWQVNNLLNQLDLGTYDVPSNVTTTFFVGLETSDLYKITNPKWWGTSWIQIIGGIILLVIGLGLIAIGVEMKEPKAIVMGALLSTIALGFEIGGIIFGVLT